MLIFLSIDFYYTILGESACDMAPLLHICKVMIKETALSLFLLLFSSFFIPTNLYPASFSGGAYNISVRIDPLMEEDWGFVHDHLETLFLSACDYLYPALKSQARCGDITIFVPDSWECGTGHVCEDIGDLDYQFDVVTFVGADWPAAAGSEQAGGRIELSNGFVRGDYWKNGRALVHEWGHFRYNLFDEYVLRAADGIDYYHNPGESDLLSCVDDIPNVSMSCRSAVPPDRCHLILDSNFGGYTHKASIMFSADLFDSVDSFCDDSTDPLYRHNRRDLTEQNVRHDRKSGWTVIEEHTDGLRRSGGIAVPYDSPNFIYKKVKKPMAIIAFDVSGSMGLHGRLFAARSAAIGFIEALDPGTTVGIVAFERGGATVLDPTLITDTASKMRIASALPTAPVGDVEHTFTSIGAGLLEAFRHYNCGDGRRKILGIFSDGLENTAPYSDSVLSSFIDCGIEINPISLSAAESSNLLAIAESTGGKFSFAPDDRNIEAASDAMLSLSQRIKERPAQTLFSDQKGVYRFMQEERIGFDVDDTIGKNTVITFKLRTPNRLRTAIIKPDGSVLNSGYEGYSENYDFRWRMGTVSYKINGIAETGTWQILIGYAGEESDDDLEGVTITVVSSPRDDKHPLELKAWLGSPAKPTVTVNFPEPVMINASLSSGFSVIDSHVYARVIHPAELSQNDTVVEMFDNGQNGDNMTGDGIYVGFFTGYSGPGTYTVYVYADNASGEAKVGSRHNPDKVRQVGFGFQRKQHAGSFELIGYEEKSALTPRIAKDRWAPSKVTSLLPIEIKKDSVKLRWNASGNNFGSGKAAAYDLRYSKKDIVSVSDFNEATRVAGVSLPKNANEGEEIIVSGLEKNSAYYIALQVVDDSSNKSPVSNVVYIDLAKAKAEDEPPSPEGNGENDEMKKEDNSGVGEGQVQGSSGGCSLLIH